jgi:putative transposase
MPPSKVHRRNYNEPGHAHELTFSCYKGHNFLGADRTRGWLVDSINDAREELNFALWAYVFMPNHAHLIIWPRESAYDIAVIRKAIKSPVGAHAIEYLENEEPHWLRRITRTRGSRIERLFWQSGGGYDRNIVDSKTLMRMIDYIHLNPVRKGSVEKAADWRWSSAAWYAGKTSVPLKIDPIRADWCP